MAGSLHKKYKETSWIVSEQMLTVLLSVPPSITGNPLTPRANISFAGLDKYAFRNKIIESKTTETNKTVGTTNEITIEKPTSINETVVYKSKINRDKVIIEDWTSDDEDDMCADKTVSSVKPNVTQAVRSQTDKSGQTSQKQGIGRGKSNQYGTMEKGILHLESWAGQTDAQRAALWHAISDMQGENQDLRLQLDEERRARLELAEVVDSMRRGQEPSG
ncbi:hypothetical protein Tco_0349747, partial [Tanacetum coccineum]